MRLARWARDEPRAADSGTTTPWTGSPRAGNSDATRGSALLSVMLLMFLFSAIAVGAALVIRVEVNVAERFRQSAEALYAAEAGLDVALSELRAMRTWTPVTAGGRPSQYSQGAFRGSKSVPGGGVVNVCCGGGSAFDRLTTESRMSAVPARRALDWQPFLWTTFDALAPRDPPSRLYLIITIADDEEDAAGEGGTDTNSMVLVRADAIDPGGLHRTIESLIARRLVELGLEGGAAGGVEQAQGAAGGASPTVLEILRWREVR